MRAVPTTVQPMALPSWSAAVPTPEPTACTSTVSPDWIAAWVTIASWAVTNTSGTPPAVTRSSESGTGAHCTAGTARSSAWPPPPAMPNTRSPSAGPVTPGPCATTSPANSSPGMSGGDPGGAA